MIKWESCVYWPDEVYFKEAGIILRAGVGDGGKWFGIAATTNTWFGLGDVEDLECRRGPARKGIEAAKKDAIRLGKELVEDMFRAVFRMRDVFGLDMSYLEVDDNDEMSKV